VKVLTAKKRAYVYPFMEEDSADPIFEQEDVLIVESNGLIRVSLNGRPSISLDRKAAKALIAGLAQAVELAATLQEATDG
jgi:hypothetical protein